MHFIGIALLVIICLSVGLLMALAGIISCMLLLSFVWFYAWHKWQQIVNWAWQDIDLKDEEITPTTREIKKAKEVSQFIDTGSKVILLHTPIDELGTAWLSVQAKSWEAPERHFCNHMKCKYFDKPIPYADMPYVHMKTIVYIYADGDEEVELEITCLKCMTTAQEIARFESNANLMDL